jgi:hypothetical protein
MRDLGLSVIGAVFDEAEEEEYERNTDNVPDTQLG